jgi:Raf kinase inhibitor-like YbhB/YbcL family protein
MTFRLSLFFLAGLLVSAGPVHAFELTSPSIPSGGTFPSAQTYHGFGCTGSNLSPALVWSGVPRGTRSLALTLYDPDAPTGSGWWHWVVVDLPASTRKLPAGAGKPGSGALPAGAVQIRNDFGTSAYGGPCPPQGGRPHRYVFTIYALKTAHLSLPPGAGPAMAGYFIHANALASARLVVRYGR